MALCAVCTSKDQREIEEVGLKALSGEISWREAARQTELTHANLKRHMENDYVARVWREEKTEFGELVESVEASLKVYLRTVPDDTKPLVLIAIHNLRGLEDTPVSQKNLIDTLKTVQQMTGLKTENRLMLQFAQQMGANKAQKELEDPRIIDAVVVDNA